LHGRQANLKRTCAPPAVGRALPENEIPPVLRVVFIGGEGEIRTLERLMTVTRFPIVLILCVYKASWVLYPLNTSKFILYPFFH